VSASDEPHALAAGVALDDVLDEAVVVDGGGLLDDAGGPASSVIGAREPGGLVRSPRLVPASAAAWLDSAPLECDEPALPDDDDELPQPLDDAPASATTSTARAATRPMCAITVHLR
jgi:hypothetical protein